MGRKTVPRAYDSLDIRIGAAVGKGFTQPSYVNVDSALLDIDIGTPDAIEQLCTGMNAVRMRHKEPQEAVLRRTQPYAISASGYAMSGSIQLKNTRRSDLIVIGRGPAEHGLNACNQLARREWLRDVVVGATFETKNLVVFRQPGPSA